MTMILKMKTQMMTPIISEILSILRFILSRPMSVWLRRERQWTDCLEVTMMVEAFNDKAEQFERLWDGITPKGINRNKSLKFRQYILEHVRQTRRPLTRDNARKYWMGILQAEIAERDNY
jgi:hypothetical protein